MSYEIEHWSSGCFSISTFGKDTPVISCLGGLAYAPSDFYEVAEKLPGTRHIINNPIHTGAMTRTQEWQKDLRNGYIKILRETKTEFILGHSCGGFDAANIANDLDGLRGFIMLTPPYGTPNNADEGRLTEFGFLDRCLAGLCQDMPDELYRTMLEEHSKEYGARVKDIYRKEIPKGKQVVANILEKIRLSRVPILVILGSQDPWNIGGDFPSLGDHISQQRIDSSHFAQRSNPNKVIAIIQEWMSRITESVRDHEQNTHDRSSNLAVAQNSHHQTHPSARP